MNDANRYVMAASAAEKESRRLALLQQIFDPGTTARLTKLGVGAGWRCLEIGAGRGSIVRWLSDRVGASGSVVAADIDPRFLDGMPANVEVRRLDVRTDALETRRYDLVHCRMLLMHLSERDAILPRMAAALKPGGCLLVEEADHALMYFSGPGGAEYTRSGIETMNAMQKAGIMAPWYGREVTDAMLRAGLRCENIEVETHSGQPGDAPYDWLAATLLDAGERLVSAGIAKPEWLELGRNYFGKPGTHLTTMSLVAVSGRSPR